MYYVYVLQSKSYPDKLYFGFTADLQKRLTRHNGEGTHFTKRFSPWLLVYYEAFQSEQDARERERRLKYDGRAWVLLKRRLQRSLYEG